MTNAPRHYTRATSHGSIADEKSCQGDLPVMRQSCASPMTLKGGNSIFRSTVWLRIAHMSHVAERFGLAMARFLSWYY
jgi:hypothetical protein